MSNNLAVVLLAGGVVAYELVNHKGEIVGSSGPNANPPTIKGTSVKPKGIVTARNSGAYQDAYPSPGKTIVSSDGGVAGTDRARSEIEAKLEAAAKEAYDKLSCDAKKEGAKKLNAQVPGLKLPEDGGACTIDSKTVIQAVVTAGYAAAGTAICGPQCGAIGGVIGAYFSSDIADWITKGDYGWEVAIPNILLGELLNDAYDEVNSWF